MKHANRRSAHRTQWAAQFGVASELCKRDYQVAFTMGNHPKVDLMVISPKGKKFAVDVKGLYTKNYWVVNPKDELQGFFYVLAFVPDNEPNRFFVLSQSEANEEIKSHRDYVRRNRIQKGASLETIGVMPSIPWKAAEFFEDKWEKLPK